MQQLFAGPRCYKTHPCLPIRVGDTLYHVYGGGSMDPTITDADLYVDLDSPVHFTMTYPWNPGFSLYFPIKNNGVPTAHRQFGKLIHYLAEQLVMGKKVYVGCIGGHGRTGLVLAALVRHMMPDTKKAIQYVRSHYCKKAVESQKQVDFLVKRWDAATAPPRRYPPPVVVGDWSYTPRFK